MIRVLKLEKDKFDFSERFFPLNPFFQKLPIHSASSLVRSGHLDPVLLGKSQ